MTRHETTRQGEPYCGVFQALGLTPPTDAGTPDPGTCPDCHAYATGLERMRATLNLPDDGPVTVTIHQLQDAFTPNQPRPHAIHYYPDPTNRYSPDYRHPHAIRYAPGATP